MYPGVHSQNTPDKAAFIMASTGQVVTYKELDEGSNRLANVFADAGLVEGDSIALMLENHPRFFEVVWAAQRSGLYYTAISSRLTAEEAEYIINDCGAQAFITSHFLAPAASDLVGKMADVKVALMLDGVVDGYEAYEAVVAAKPSTPIANEREGADMLYSSGTTGRPKGVKVPLPNVAAGAPSSVQALGQMLYGFNGDMVYLSPAPLYHAAPLRFTMAVQRLGGTVIVMEHFDPAEFIKLVAQYKVTHTQVVPTMFVRMLKLDASERVADMSSLQVCIHAAAPCPVDTKRSMIEWWGPIIYEYYAGTEGNGFVACNSEEWLAHPGTVGKPMTAAAHIIDEESGQEVAVGETGTVYFEGGANTFEYHNDPEKTKASRLANGWSTLGDIGRMDGDGYLYLTDRKAYMIISGGVNVYPQEAENLLVTHPKVMDVAVFGVPNADFGEEVKAVVQPMNWDEAGPELERELIAFAKEHLAGIKCPRSIDFEPELPRHPTGKLYKRLLRDRYWPAAN